MKVHSPSLESDGEKQTEKQNKRQLNSQQFGDHSRMSQRRGLRHIALLLKLKDRRSTEFLAFIRSVVYTAVIFSVHLVDLKGEVSTTVSTREI